MNKEQKFKKHTLVMIDEDTKAIILYSYAEEFGGNTFDSYAVFRESKGFLAWVEEDEIELIETDQEELLKKWERELKAKKMNAIKSIKMEDFKYKRPNNMCERCIKTFTVPNSIGAKIYQFELCVKCDRLVDYSIKTLMINKENICGLRLYMNDFPEIPSHPEKIVDYAWIVQSMGDQVLILYLFPNIFGRRFRKYESRCRGSKKTRLGSFRN